MQSFIEVINMENDKDKKMITLTVGCKRLLQLELGTSNPMLSLHFREPSKNAQSEWQPLGMTEMAKDTLWPTFDQEFQIDPVDYLMEIKVDVYDCQPEKYVNGLSSMALYKYIPSERRLVGSTKMLATDIIAAGDHGVERRLRNSLDKKRDAKLKELDSVVWIEAHLQKMCDAKITRLLSQEGSQVVVNDKFVPVAVGCSNLVKFDIPNYGPCNALVEVFIREVGLEGYKRIGRTELLPGVKHPLFTQTFDLPVMRLGDHQGEIKLDVYDGQPDRHSKPTDPTPPPRQLIGSATMFLHDVVSARFKKGGVLSADLKNHMTSRQGRVLADHGTQVYITHAKPKKRMKEQDLLDVERALELTRAGDQKYDEEIANYKKKYQHKVVCICMYVCMQICVCRCVLVCM